MSKKIEIFESVWAYVRSFPKSDRSRYTKEQRKRVGERYAVLAKMERQLKAHVGQLVLVIVRRMVDYGCSMGMPARRIFPIREEGFRLGVISSPGFLMRKSSEYLSWNTAITTDKHVVRGTPMPGPIEDDVFAPFLTCLDKPLQGDTFSVRERTALQVVAGDQAVCEWAIAEQEEERIQTMARLLDHYLVFRTLVERRRQERNHLAQQIEQDWLSRRSDGDLVRTLRRLIELGVDEAMPNIHLVRHIAQHFRITM